MALYNISLNIKRGSPKGTISRFYEVEAETRREALQELKLIAIKEGLILSHFKKPVIKKTPESVVDNSEGKKEVPAYSTNIDEQIKVVNELIADLEIGQRIRLPHIPDEVYFGTVGIGSTAMRAAHETMAHYKAYIDSDTVTSPQLQIIYDFGSGAHCAVLESDKFEERFAQMPEGMVRRGKEHTEFKESNQGKTLLSFDAYNHIVNIRKAIDSAKKMHELTSMGVSEVAYYYKDESGLILKAKIDHDFEGDLGIDLKTTKSAKPDKAVKTAKEDYSVQCALYRLVAGLPEFVFLMVEKVPPYAKSMAKNGASVRERADRRLREVIEQIVFAEMVDSWPAYDEDTIHESELNSWEMQDE